MIRHIAFAAPLVVWTGLAEAASTQTVWQGDAFITAVTDACTPGLTAEVGDYYRVVYRPKLNGTDPAEGLAFIGSRNDYLATSTSGTAVFQGSGNYSGTYISSRATTGKTTGAFQLSITPSPIAAGTNTVSISGTITNWFAVTGCDVTIRSASTRRP